MTPGRLRLKKDQKDSSISMSSKRRASRSKSKALEPGNEVKDQITPVKDVEVEYDLDGRIIMIGKRKPKGDSSITDHSAIMSEEHVRQLQGEVPTVINFGPKLTKQSSEASDTRFNNLVIQDVNMFGAEAKTEGQCTEGGFPYKTDMIDVLPADCACEDLRKTTEIKPLQKIEVATDAKSIFN